MHPHFTTRNSNYTQSTVDLNSHSVGEVANPLQATGDLIHAPSSLPPFEREEDCPNCRATWVELCDPPPGSGHIARLQCCQCQRFLKWVGRNELLKLAERLGVQLNLPPP